MAMIAQRLGLSTALIERGRHPRFVIGESSTPLANLLLEEISDEYDLPFVRPLCKWGTWQKQLPQLPCGLKRGFTFYHHQFGALFGKDAERQRQLLVGASPNEEIADTHWYRPDFDHYLVRQAQNLGVTYWDETELNSAREETTCMRLAGTRHGRPLEITAEFVIDASGPRGFLHRTLGLVEKPFPGFPRTQALFSHFNNAGSLPRGISDDDSGLPYPPAQAAVHHVFPGGWVWALNFNNGITSAGVAAIDAVANNLEFSAGEAGWRRLLEQLPSLGEIFGAARATIPFIHLPRLAFQSGTVTGGRWALLPSAAGFIDPLLSTGFSLTLLGVARLGQSLRSSWQRPALQNELRAYAELTALELETTSQLVSALYATMGRFDLFKQLTLLYFAASSYSETVRRLGKPQLADGFLLCRHPSFRAQVRQICEAATHPLSADNARKLIESIRTAIEPFDVAGLTDQSRDPWYPATASDLLRQARKVGTSEAEIMVMLRRCGLEPG
jgi:FADH2 O2-dependent halogenase